MKEQRKVKTVDAEEDLSFWHQIALDSDFCKEGDMREPTREQVREMIAKLDRSQPGWRARMRENSFAIQLMDNFPLVTKKGLT